MARTTPRNDSAVKVAFEKVYGPVIQLASRLPAPLAYGIAVLVAFLVAYILITLLGSSIPNAIIWFILVIDITALLAFVFLDWNKRKRATAKVPLDPSIDHLMTSSVFYVVVHEAGDQTNVIADADVTLALPEPVTRKTGLNGGTNFTVANELIGREFTLNARKGGYLPRKPIQVVLRRQGHEFIALEPIDGGATASILRQASVQKDRPAGGGPTAIAASLVYDSNLEEKAFSSWVLYSDTRENQIVIVTEDEFAAVFKLSAVANGKVGANKSFRTLHGRIEFDYKVEASSSGGANIFFYMIPMQETGSGRSGLIEVGTNVEDDDRNSFSPYRIRFLVPRKHYGDGHWHHGSQEFDFREIPEAFYSIFGPRINEGATHPATGTLLFTNVKLFSYEGVKEIS